MNRDLKLKMAGLGIRQWEVAKRYGLNDGNFSRLLREELPEDKRCRIIAIIDEMTAEREKAVSI